MDSWYCFLLRSIFFPGNPAMLRLLPWVAQKSISKSGSLRGKDQHGAQDMEAKGLTLGFRSWFDCKLILEQMRAGDMQ